MIGPGSDKNRVQRFGATVNFINQTFAYFTCAKTLHKKVVPSWYLQTLAKTEERNFESELSVQYLIKIEIRDDKPHSTSCSSTLSTTYLFILLKLSLVAYMFVPQLSKEVEKLILG